MSPHLLMLYTWSWLDSGHVSGGGSLAKLMLIEFNVQKSITQPML